MLGLFSVFYNLTFLTCHTPSLLLPFICTNADFCRIAPFSGSSCVRYDCFVSSLGHKRSFSQLCSRPDGSPGKRLPLFSPLLSPAGRFHLKEQLFFLSFFLWPTQYTPAKTAMSLTLRPKGKWYVHVRLGIGI